jgi:predicted ferric reductase
LQGIFLLLRNTHSNVNHRTLLTRSAGSWRMHSDSGFAGGNPSRSSGLLSVFFAKSVLDNVTYISKVIQHPSHVMELQIKKEKIKTRAGQYIFLSCPEVSYFQWHPFTLTSAPEEDYLSVHIRVVGDFTISLAKTLGCDFPDQKNDEKNDAPLGGKVIGTNSNPPLNRTLPRVMVDGPFGSASEDF